MELGEHNTQIQELRRDLYGLRGSFDGISDELRNTVDEKLAAFMEEFKSILVTIVGN